MIPTLLGITMVTFLIIRLAPGDPVAFSIAASGGFEGGGDFSDRERQIVRSKIRLGLLEETATIRSWDSGSGRRVGTTTETDAVLALATSPGGTIVAAGTADGRIVLRPIEPGRAPRTIEAHGAAINAVAFSPDGTLIASCSDDRTARVWDVETGRPVATCAGHGLLVRCAAFADDDLLITGSRDATVRVWNARTGELVDVIEAHIGEVTGVESLSGGVLVSASRDRTVRFWDAATRREVGAPVDCGAPVHAIDVAADGSRIAAGLGDNAVALIDTARRAVTARLDGHTAVVESVALGDGDLLVSGGRDASVRLWDVAAGRLRATLAGHSGVVRAVAVGDGGRVVSAALDVDDVPLVPAYVDWLSRLVRLDFGLSFKDDRPVWDKIVEAMPVTLELNLVSILITYLLSIPLGVFSAARRNSMSDQATTLVLFLLYSMPSFWVATMLIILLGSPAGPTGGILPFVNLHSDNAGDLPFLSYVWDHLLHLVLPLTALTYASFAFLSRLVRSSMLEALSQDAVRTARAKGLPERRVVGVHALRNGLLPVVTVFGNLLPTVIGGSVIIERIYSLPGMGSLGFEAVLQRDYPVIMGITTLVAVLTMIGILISDLLYCIVDPRIELK